MENSTLLTEKPIQGRSGAAKGISLMNTLKDIKGTWYTVPDNSRGGGFTRPKDEFLKKDKNFIRNVISGINQKSFRKEDVSGIIQQGVSSYLNQNKNISVKDLLTPDSRKKAGNQLKSTLKSTALDTGQNVINHLRKEEVSRRKKPSNVRKAKRLEYALLTLKQKKDDAKKAGALKEGDARANKLADAVRSGITTGTIPSLKVNKLDKIITKIRGIKEQVSKMKPSDYKTPGRTHDIKAKEVKDNELATREPDKGSALATQGKKDNEVKDERKPKPYRDKKKERKGIKGPSKDAINKTVSKVGSAAKSGLSAFTSGYDNEDVKEQKSFNQYAEDAYAAKQGAGAWMLGKGLEGIANVVKLGSTIFNMSKKKDEVKRPKDPVKPTPKDGESWTGGIEGRPTRNLSGRYQTYKKNQQKLKDFNDTLTTSSPGVEYKKQPKPNITKGDNPESRENIRKDLDKINQKNNKLYNDYHNPKPPG